MVAAISRRSQVQTPRAATPTTQPAKPKVASQGISANPGGKVAKLEAQLDKAIPKRDAASFDPEAVGKLLKAAEGFSAADKAAVVKHVTTRVGGSMPGMLRGMLNRFENPVAWATSEFSKLSDDEKQNPEALKEILDGARALPKAKRSELANAIDQTYRTQLGEPLPSMLRNQLNHWVSSR